VQKERELALLPSRERKATILKCRGVFAGLAAIETKTRRRPEALASLFFTPKRNITIDKEIAEVKMRNYVCPVNRKPSPSAFYPANHRKHRPVRAWRAIFSVFLGCLWLAGPWPAEEARSNSPAKKAGDRSTKTNDTPALAPVRWHADYDHAAQTARRENRMMFIFFVDSSERCMEFEKTVLLADSVRVKLGEFVCAKLPLEAEATNDGQRVSLLEYGGFRHMEGRPGVAIVDFAHREQPYYGCVVSAFPLTDKLHYTPEKMAVILDLPPGTLTQRTLIYAVRTHHDKPASAESRFCSHLAAAAESHAEYQAKLGVQGHHHWERRFHQINRLLPAGATAVEVCAESWPGENIVEAAIECVRCWRLSDGHWSAVRARHHAFGYDMKRGRNGVWYATGIFGRLSQIAADPKHQPTTGNLIHR
jgi:hypothetical protein